MKKYQIFLLILMMILLGIILSGCMSPTQPYVSPTVIPTVSGIWSGSLSFNGVTYSIPTLVLQNQDDPSQLVIVFNIFGKTLNVLQAGGWSLVGTVDSSGNIMGNLPLVFEGALSSNFISLNISNFDGTTASLLLTNQQPLILNPQNYDLNGLWNVQLINDVNNQQTNFQWKIYQEDQYLVAVSISSYFADVGVLSGTNLQLNYNSGVATQTTDHFTGTIVNADELLGSWSSNYGGSGSWTATIQ